MQIKAVPTSELRNRSLRAEDYLHAAKRAKMGRYIARLEAQRDNINKKRRSIFDCCWR